MGINSAVSEVKLTNQLFQNHLGCLLKIQIPEPTLDLQNQNLWGGGPGICTLTPYSGDCNMHRVWESLKAAHACFLKMIHSFNKKCGGPDLLEVHGGTKE